MSWLHKSGGEWSVYVIAEQAADDAAKVGTARNVAYRLSGLQNGNWRKLVVVLAVRCASRNDALVIEKDAQAHFAGQRIPGRDWIMCHPVDLAEFVRTHPLAKGAS